MGLYLKKFYIRFSCFCYCTLFMLQCLQKVLICVLFIKESKSIRLT